MSDDNAKSNSSENVNNGFPLEELVESLSQNPQLISIVEVRAKFQRSRERERVVVIAAVIFSFVFIRTYTRSMSMSPFLLKYFVYYFIPLDDL